MAYGYDGKKLQVVYREPPDRSWKNIQYRGDKIRTVSFNRKNGVTTSSVKTRFNPTPFTKIIAFLVIFLLFAFILRYGVFIDDITSGTRSIGSILPTFRDFLETVISAPVIKPVFEVIKVNLGDSWGIFDVFRVLLDSTISITNFVFWLCQNLISFLQYVFYFVKWLFITA